MTLKKSRNWHKSDKTKYSDDAFRRLVRRMEQGPPEVISLILQELYNDSEIDTLHALKLAGRNIYSQLSPFIHEKLTIDLEKHTEQDFYHLSTMSWLKHVQTLYLLEHRTDISCPPRQQYFSLLELLSKLHNVRSALLHFPKDYEEAANSILDVISVMPRLELLSVLGANGWGIPEGSDDEDEDGDEHAVVYTTEEDDQAFDSLKTMYIVDANTSVLYWICNRFDRPPTAQPRVGTLVSVRIEGECSFIRESLSFIRSQGNSLKKLCIDRSKCQDEGPWDDCLPARMPKLEFLSCVGFPEYENKDTMDDCAALLHFIEAPCLQSLGCGHLLDGHSTAICRILAEEWSRKSPKLQYIVAYHFEPREFDFTGDDIERNALLRQNIETVRTVFAGREVQLLCLGEEEYGEYLRDQIPEQI